MSASDQLTLFGDEEVVDEGVLDDDHDDEDNIARDDLTTHDVRRRAVTGAVVDGFRAIGVQLLGIIGTLVTARLLTPYDFGLVAIGTTVYAFSSFLDDGGVGVALIRRPKPPSKADLQALVAFQLAIDVAAVVGIGLVMLDFGRIGEVTIVIVASLPLGALRAPAYILYERRLNYRPMAVVEVVQTAAYYVWAITTIIIGWGVWGLATAFVLRELVGLVLVLILLPEGRIAPRPSWSRVRPLLSFGARYQAVGLAHMVRDQGVNIVLATFGGVAVLGLWNIAWRVIQIPVSLLAALWRVSFPSMAKLVAAGEDLGPTIERVIALVAIGTGVLIVPLAASASGWIQVLIGHQWANAASAISPACFAMAFGVPISVALTGYLWAIGDAATPLRSTILGIPAAMVLLLALLPFVGVAAAGTAYIASAGIESLFFVRAARRRMTVRVGRGLTVPVLLATGSALAGWLVERWIGADLAGALASSLVALAAFLGGLTTFQRAAVADAWTLSRRGLSGVVASDGDRAASPPPRERDRTDARESLSPAA